MSDTFERFTCASCGEGTVVPAAGVGRQMVYRNFPALSLPQDLLIPTCSKCGDQWFDQETLENIDRALREQAQSIRHSIAADAIRVLSASANQRDLEATLDLSPGYLSKVKHGREAPSAVLTAALALLAARPARMREVLRIWSAKKLIVRAPASSSVTGFDSVPEALPELAEAA